MSKVKQGKIINIEGIDGSGKSTQKDMLVEYLKSLDYETASIHYPRHGMPVCGNMVDEYLCGVYGQAQTIHPKLAATLYAIDRFESKPQLIKWLKQDKIIVLDRYVASNLGHQMAKIINYSTISLDKFINWLYELEYTVFKLPKPDAIIYLKIPAEVAYVNVVTRGETDGHETLDFLKQCTRSYNYIAKKSSDWIVINCVNENGKMLPAQMIHECIVQKIKEKNIL